MLTEYYKKNKEKYQKRLVKGIKILLKKKKTKSINMLLNNIEIFLKKKQPKSVNMVMGYIFLGICINFTNNRTNAVAENLKTLKIFPFYAKYTIL